MIKDTAIIVGSGAAGAILAKTLLEKQAFKKIVMFEAGGAYKLQDQRKWLDFIMAEEDPYEHGKDCLATRKKLKKGFDPDTFEYTPDCEPEQFHPKFDEAGLYESRLMIEGGSVNHMGGWSLRMKPEDFKQKTNLGNAGDLFCNIDFLDWEISYEQLKDFYHRAEILLGVTGDSNNDDPPRFGKKYPFEAMSFTATDQSVYEALGECKISYSALPITRFANKCRTVGTCKYCPEGARYTPVMTIRELHGEYADQFRLVRETTVTKIEMDNAGKAIAVKIKTKDQDECEMTLNQNDTVFVCAGALESPILLSESGIGGEHVGKHLLFHHRIQRTGQIKNQHKLQDELNIHTLCSRHFDSEEEQKLYGKFFFIKEDKPRMKFEDLMIEKRLTVDQIEEKIKDECVEIELSGFVEEYDRPSPNGNYVKKGKNKHLTTGTFEPDISYEMSPVTVKAIDRALTHMENILEEMGCFVPDRGGEFVVFPARPDHVGGTCRMSPDIDSGVVDENLRVHGTENVYVCSNAVMPNIGAVNPTITLVALTIRLGEHISGL